jgi:hypothetical protein
MILNKLIFYNKNYWKKIIKSNFIIFFYEQIIKYKKMKKIKKLKWLMSRKHIHTIFSRDKLKYVQRNFIKNEKKIKKIKLLKNKQYTKILFKLKKKYKERKKIKKLIYKKNKLNA